MIRFTLTKSAIFFHVRRAERLPDWRWTNHPDDALLWAVFGAIWAGVGAALVVASVTGCAAPAILGGPTEETTTQTCWDGSKCPNWATCPSLIGGGCEGPPAESPAMTWGAQRRVTWCDHNCEANGQGSHGRLRAIDDAGSVRCECPGMRLLDGGVLPP